MEILKIGFGLFGEMKNLNVHGVCWFWDMTIFYAKLHFSFKMDILKNLVEVWSLNSDASQFKTGFKLTKFHSPKAVGPGLSFIQYMRYLNKGHVIGG